MQNIPTPKLIDFFNYINWRDITYVFVIQLLLRFGFINVFQFENPLTNSLFFVLVFSILFMTLSGYLLNGYFRFKHSRILITSIIFLILGVLLGVFVSYEIDKLHKAILLLIVAIVITFISISLVNRSFIKTIAISMLMAFSLLVNWWYSEPTKLDPNNWKLFIKLEIIVIVFSLLLFVGNLARAMLYSLKNIQTDKLKSKETFPIVFGVKKTKQTIILISILATIVIFTAVFIYATKLITYFIIIPAHAIPQSILLIKLNNSFTQKEYKNLLVRLDIMLYTSVIFIPIVAFLIKKFTL